ncbi:FAD:protein FMN transferase [Spongiibacter nanhainus]|uniref:FAD:protein FMN transferase n=1 Tax=Spongiibacter nanhainus TaxID=2794344 RepID=A0A7T4R198_9GAMM|nr:FAD:protein FMN transferase [Spongiibacter nanhainus]QQD18601.1 FAD:protein FMN transferase [Spongiibacter nanhainus]
MQRQLTFKHTDSGLAGQFDAMASPCEVLIDSTDPELAQRVAETVAQEAWRIEGTFSRYRNDNIVYRINNANGEPVEVDGETAQLLDFAQQAYQISDGAFDLTSGVLRRAWKFDGSDRLPAQSQIDSLLQVVGWEKLHWQSPTLRLQPGMEIDFGGIGKEYAVDRAAALVLELTDTPVLINFGGDLFATAPPAGQPHWLVGVESIGGLQSAMIQLQRGGLATSGDARRFLLKKGKRYPHVLNPRTGWPVMGAPRSVTVAASTCIEAGLLATLAMLEGQEAEAFLAAQEVLQWVQR